mmetsp:Transcript_22659/g.56117  ORF Transcript_22659/g.56117 Transcript_22659/m.56117 type:complete len:213 (-) Transcript_22659:48-686(-)
MLPKETVEAWMGVSMTSWTSGGILPTISSRGSMTTTPCTTLERKLVMPRTKRTRRREYMWTEQSIRKTMSLRNFQQTMSLKISTITTCTTTMMTITTAVTAIYTMIISMTNTTCGFLPMSLLRLFSQSCQSRIRPTGKQRICCFWPCPTIMTKTSTRGSFPTRDSRIRITETRPKQSGGCTLQMLSWYSISARVHDGVAKNTWISAPIIPLP